MKSYNEIAKKYKPKEIAESFVFPGSKNKETRRKQIEAFREYRKQAEAGLSKKDKLISRLLQLKFQMEDYINSKDVHESYSFGYFLEEYILRLEMKKKNFADSIGIDPTELSQVINRHRPPSDKLIMRLDIHSNKNFPASLWLKLTEKEKAYSLMHDYELREHEGKYVKGSLKFSLR
ncbi:MAG TPA: hypothetical protein VHA52_13880 [Candidatus Babeliaceae bacterium]|nr:hypothetical protein [Candidatus Babeliaceae bacterium]